MGHGVIVVCRMNSSRLPGKTLAPVGDHVLLWYVWSRLASLSQDGVAISVATSDGVVDQPIADFCAEQGIDCFRGAGDDVAHRLIQCAQQRRWRLFARVNGDSPFVSPSLIRLGFRMLETTPLDFVTNLAPRSFPYGVAVEAMRTDWYADFMSTVTDPEQREHVTKRIYEHLDQVRYRNLVRPGTNLRHRSVTIDTPADLQWFRRLVAGLEDPWTAIDYHYAVSRFAPQRKAA